MNDNEEKKAERSKIATEMFIGDIKAWINIFNIDNPLDCLLANVVMSVLVKIGTKIYGDYKQQAENGELYYDGQRASDIIIIELRNLADHYEKIDSGTH